MNTELKKTPESIWVTTPTIDSIRAALLNLENAGIATDTPLNIVHLANAPGTFVFEKLKEA
jgi:hypothetical protein